MKENKWLLIVLAIVIGIVLSCAIVPLGGFALLIAAASGSAESGPLPPRSWQEQVVSGSGTDRLVIIEVTGMIGATESGFLNDQTSHQELLAQIRQATNDPLVRAIVLRVESPGGGVVASNEIYEALKAFQQKGKSLVVSMGGVAASGGYYVSAGADKIYANPDTLTGSLGVILMLVQYDEAFEKLGLEQVVYKSGKFKDIGSPARDATPEEQKILQEYVDQAYQGFVDVIVEGRGLPRDKVLELADGRIYSGKQALERDLVDEMGNLDDAIQGAREMTGLSEVLVVRYRRSTSLENLLRSYLVQSQRPADPFGVRELVLEQTPRLEYRMVP
ncbi:MAG: signal peptide peptidase SppA [Chloroflexaceae bacterium]|nr:signal peptide peptidase SppA [Chloroflexaceae bacterium]